MGGGGLVEMSPPVMWPTFKFSRLSHPTEKKSFFETVPGTYFSFAGHSGHRGSDGRSGNSASSGSRGSHGSLLWCVTGPAGE